VWYSGGKGWRLGQGRIYVAPIRRYQAIFEVTVGHQRLSY
jgi:hypothetical protein